MATSRGGGAVDAMFADTPKKLEGLLRGAARAGAKVIATEAKARCISPEVESAIKVATKRTDTKMEGLVQVKGPGAFIAPWLEYGTGEHFIAVDDSVRRGRSIGRINRQAGEEGASHSLVIGGNFVGATVLHPGARPHPFMRVALDLKGAEAVAAAQAHIDSRVSSRGIAASGGEGDDA